SSTRLPTTSVSPHGPSYTDRYHNQPKDRNLGAACHAPRSRLGSLHHHLPGPSTPLHTTAWP
ncbi:hypothetical protein Pmani_023649, partial [Petrolisthes manimaculis]